MRVEEILGYVAAGVIGLLLGKIKLMRRQAAEQQRKLDDLIELVNRQAEESRISGQQRQAMASSYEHKIREQQDVIDILSDQLSSVRRFHYN